jgi:AcrR family transcriptional regulator
VTERHQRERIFAAVATGMAKHGYSELTIDRIIRPARVSRTTFYRHFADKRDAVTTAHAQSLARLRSKIEEACRSESEWAEKVKVAIEATVDFAIAEPARAQLLATGFLGADLTLTRGVRVSYEELATLLSEGRRQRPEAEALPALTEQALVGAIVSVLGRGLLSSEPECIDRMRAELSQFALIPYLGHSAAARAVGAT